MSISANFQYKWPILSLGAGRTTKIQSSAFLGPLTIFFPKSVQNCKNSILRKLRVTKPEQFQNPPAKRKHPHPPSSTQIWLIIQFPFILGAECEHNKKLLERPGFGLVSFCAIFLLQQKTENVFTFLMFHLAEHLDGNRRPFCGDDGGTGKICWDRKLKG